MTRQSEDSRRRQYILTALLIGTLVLSAMALIASIAHQFFGGQAPYSNPLMVPTISIGLVLLLWRLSTNGYYRIGAWILVGLLFASGTYLVYQWSFELPQGELLYALVIVMVGIVTSAQTGLVVTGLISVIIAGFAVLQGQHYLHPNISWLGDDVEIEDVVLFIGTFWVMALVSWLSNREIDASLRRARRSEAELEAERDNLEIKVLERTRQLEQTQMGRLMELQRFAEFGRFSAGLVHDLANPLTAASLHLELLSQQEQSQLARQAMKSVRYMERYVEAARKQLQKESGAQIFSVSAELRQVVDMLSHKARAEKVTVSLQCPGSYQLFGDPVKFSQLVANLITNAIDAYGDISRTHLNRNVTVEVARHQGAIVVTVQDWGSGVLASEMSELFTPFYSTKQSGGRGTGIGLAVVKQIVQDDFNGSITVSSDATHGTRFVARLQAGEYEPQATSDEGLVIAVEPEQTLQGA